jgi:hypothetical protein
MSNTKPAASLMQRFLKAQLAQVIDYSEYGTIQAVAKNLNMMCNRRMRWSDWFQAVENYQLPAPS